MGKKSNGTPNIYKLRNRIIFAAWVCSEILGINIVTGANGRIVRETGEVYDACPVNAYNYLRGEWPEEVGDEFGTPYFTSEIPTPDRPEPLRSIVYGIDGVELQPKEDGSYYVGTDGAAPVNPELYSVGRSIAGELRARGVLV